MPAMDAAELKRSLKLEAKKRSPLFLLSFYSPSFLLGDFTIFRLAPQNNFVKRPACLPLAVRRAANISCFEALFCSGFAILTRVVCSQLCKSGCAFEMREEQWTSSYVVRFGRRPLQGKCSFSSNMNDLAMWNEFAARGRISLRNGGLRDFLPRSHFWHHHAAQT